MTVWRFGAVVVVSCVIGACESATGSGDASLPDSEYGDLDVDAEGDTPIAPADAATAPMDVDGDRDSSLEPADTVAEDDGADLDVGSDTLFVALETPPTDADALVQWLRSGEYLDWEAEAAIHESTGPHFGMVRTFANSGASQKSGAQFPPGTAFVKEMYGKSAGEVLGWSVMVRTTDASGGGAWWWYERYGDSVYAASQGAGLCTGCHAAGQDLVLTPYPFQLLPTSTTSAAGPR